MVVLGLFLWQSSLLYIFNRGLEGKMLVKSGTRANALNSNIAGISTELLTFEINE